MYTQWPSRSGKILSPPLYKQFDQNDVRFSSLTILSDDRDNQATYNFNNELP